MYAIRFSSDDKLSLVGYSIETILNGKKMHFADVRELQPGVIFDWEHSVRHVQ